VFQHNHVQQDVRRLVRSAPDSLREQDALKERAVPARIQTKGSSQAIDPKSPLDASAWAS